jgi:biopolymer transport protein TolR
MQTGKRGKHGLTEINVTPLVDVMLVLLIIFMVSAPMMQQGVPLKLPKADASPAPMDKSEIVISVQANKDVYIADMKVSLKTLEDKLKALREDNPTRKVMLRADESVSYGTVIRVMAAVERAGVHDLGMLTDPEPK